MGGEPTDSGSGSNPLRKPNNVPSEIPINTDSVKCSPLIEIRDSQSRGISNPSVFYAPQAGTTIPGHLNVEIESSYNHLSAQDPMRYQLPSRRKNSPYSANLTMMDHISNTASDMDVSGSSDTRHRGSRSSSYKDSSSRTSFSPPAGIEEQHAPYRGNQLSKNSPSTIDSGSSVHTPGVTSAAEAMFFEIPDAPFLNFQQPQLFPTGFEGGAGDVTMSSGWELGSIEVTATGLTPLTDSWSEVLPSESQWTGGHNPH